MINKLKKNKPESVYFINMYDSEKINEIDRFHFIEPKSDYISHEKLFEISDSLNYVSNQMNPNDFSMFTMKNIGYNYNEIGMEFNISSQTISNRLNYIRTKIKKIK